MEEQAAGGPVPAEDVLAAVRDLPGVAGARVVRRRGRPDEVRLTARPGHGPEAVAGAVRAALAPPAPSGSADDAPDGHADAAPDRQADEDPDVLDLTDRGRPVARAGAATRVVVETDGAGGSSRLELQRLRVGTEGFGAVAEVVLADGDVLHVGAAETAATPDGTRRALATATAQALESAGAGAVRIEVDGVQVQPVAGRPTVVVALSVVSSRGAEHLAGCALAEDDPGRAVVAAVLSAANRRIELAMAERADQP